MELAEGPTLADRIRQGPLPLEDVLKIARQMADALEYAHEKSIIHRDLKPANIKVATDDTVKVLDFGLAKALEGDPSSIDISTSPTISRMATMQGVLLGTAAYMSPEQAKAKTVDRRADIWAFGCVLYEMLTGKQAFTGETVTDTLASIIKEEPDWSLLPPATPMRARVLLQRCLQKDPKQRLRDIGDARISLEEVLSDVPEGTPSPAVGTPAKQWRWWLASGIAVVIVASAASLVTWSLKPSPVKPVTRTVIDLPAGQHLAGLDHPALTISADGNQLAYVATTQGGTQQIYLRAMDSAETRPIVGTEGATDPFFSPDGQWLGFFAEGRLNKISVNGGVAQTLAYSTQSRGASWGAQHTIIYAPFLSNLLQVPDVGGNAQPMAPLGKEETSHLWPELLPGNKGVLFDVALPNPMIAVQPIGTGRRRNLIQGQTVTMSRYAPSGHLIYVQSGNLMAVPFDPERLEVKGGAVPVVQGVLQSSDFSLGAQYSISATGSLVYVSGGLTGVQSKLVWVSRSGTEQPLAAPADGYDMPRLSPDGRRIAVGIGRTGSSQVYLYDIAHDTSSRITFEGTSNQFPVWTSDGKRIAFMSTQDIFWQLVDGTGGLERLTSHPISVPFSSSPDGRALAEVEVVPPAAPEILVLSLSDRKAQPFLQVPRGTFQDAPQFSPDGRWLAYISDESGRREIYVQPYPGPGGKWQVSTDGGTEPQWNRNGRELFYRNGDKMMAVDISTQTGFAAGKPRQLFGGRYLMNAAGYARPNYDVSPDGQRFLMVKPVEQEQAAPTQINVVLNWTEELKRLVPMRK
jgi:serine/threonine-protein kinase